MPATPESLLAQWESEPALCESDRFPLRLDILDQLDAHFPVIAQPSLAHRAGALRCRLEAANSQLYQSIRREIQQGIRPALFTRQLTQPTAPTTGIHYDHLDELLAGVFAFPEPKPPQAPASPENVFYQPTPARHIFTLIRQSALSDTDVLIDLGSGLGHVPLLVAACTSAPAIGIEFEPAYADSARQCAQDLNLRNVSFLMQDARAANLSRGTIFYLYTPFTGSILRAVLNQLRTQGAARQIRVATFGPCAAILAEEPWLTPATDPAEDQITIFHSLQITTQD